MDSIRILLIDDDGRIGDVLTGIEASSGAGLKSAPCAPFEVLEARDAERALTLCVMESPDLCLIRMLDTPDVTVAVLAGLDEAGLDIPVTVITPPAAMYLEGDLIARGARGVLPDDGALEALIRYTIRNASVLKTAGRRLREDREALLAQILELRDGRERAEEQSIQHLEIAEELALAKTRLERLDQEKNKLFSIIAHDLRSPFTALLGYTAMIARTAPNLTAEEISTFAQKAHDSGSNIFRLLENLLEWARLQMDRLDYAPKQENLKNITTPTLGVLGPVAKQKGLRLTCHLEEESAYIDPNMIATVIRNLVNNAIKFTSAGEISIFAETLPEHIAVSVRDSGIGMPPEVMKGIFSMSENVSTRGTDGEPGTGLGVLLCKELVERGGGTLNVVSAPGKGSTFTFTVPRMPEHAPAANNETAEEARPTP